MGHRGGLPGGRSFWTMGVVALATLVPAAAWAQDVPKAPRVIVIGFEDAPDGRDCDDVAARVGRCVEEVTFRDTRDLFAAHRGTETRARLETYSRLYAWIWEDLARRSKGDDVVEATLVASGITRMPDSALLWDATGTKAETYVPIGESADDGVRVYAAPAKDLWVDATDWVGGTPTSPPIYRSLQYSQPAGLVAVPPMVLMKGRFAVRLVYDGRSHQYDIMDGDPESSGPFFEQMYPYEQALAARGGVDEGQGGGGDEDEDLSEEYSSGADDWWGDGAGGFGWQTTQAPVPSGAAGDAPPLVLDDDGFGFEEFGAYHYQSLEDDDAPAQAQLTSDIPLSHFLADEAIKTPPRGGWETEEAKRLLVEARRTSYSKTLLPLEADLGDLESMAHAEFFNFYENVGTQIVRFAREEYTPTHLRVLTALMAMHDPPGTVANARGLTKEAVAASEGQLDDDTALMAEAAAAFGGSRSFTLNYKELPKPVVEKRLEEMELWRNPDRKFLIDYTREVATQFKQLLKPRVEPLAGLDDDSLKKWAEVNAKDSRRAAFILSYVRPIALEVIVRRIGDEKGKNERDRIETSLILDHVRYEYVSRFSTDAAVRQTPGELEGMAAEQWMTVLKAHGFYANAIATGPGAVDPLAICTTLDRAAALEEPVFGIINVDGLVVAPDGLQDKDVILWHARDQLPFLLVDDPLVNAPEITRIVSLPGERAIYRIRWKLWSGWHLLWAPEPVSVQDQQYRLALRTAALCDDMVMAPPRLVPTLVRAAVLDGDFRPVNPIQGNGEDSVEEFYEKPSNQEIYDASNDQVGLATDTAQLTENIVEGAELVTTVGDSIGLAQRLFKKKEVQAPVFPVSKASVKYLYDLVAEPLREKVSYEPGVLVVMDESQVRDKKRVAFNKPRTPYMLARAREGEGWRYAATWAYFLPPADSDLTDRVLLAPSFLPTQSVQSNSMVQKWSRRQTGDWSLSTSLGVFPYRRAMATCPEDDGSGADNSTVGKCDPDELEPAYSSGINWDFVALRTLWKSAYDRWAIEFGPEFNLDLFTPGGSWFLNEDEGDVSYALTLKYMGGFVVGVRFAPGATPQSTNAGSYPWGADRPDGSASLGRFQYGFRAGALLGPGFNGLEITAQGEAWTGWSLRRKRAKDATFTPYHPAIVLGPYVRASYNTVLAKGTREYNLAGATTLYAGVRLDFRLDGAAGQPPISAE